MVRPNNLREQGKVCAMIPRIPLVLLASGLALLTGCSDEVDEPMIEHGRPPHSGAAAGQGGAALLPPPPSGGPPPAGGPPPVGGPPRGETSGAPAGVEGPEASVSGRIPLLNRRPKEAEAGGNTLWIRGSVPGVEVGQVRFHSAGSDGSALQVICLAEVVNGRFEAEAPPAGPDVFVSVVALAADADPGAEHPWGALPAPLSLAGEDHEVSLSIGTRATWTLRLNVPPERIVGVGEVNPR